MAKNAGGYVGWEEVVVSGEKGRREVHYYLKDARGGLDLAVVGRERSARHMSYAVPARFFRSLGADAVLSLPPAQASSPPSSLSCASTVTSVSGGATPSRSSPSPPSSSLSAGSLSFKCRSRREVIDWLSSIVSGTVNALGDGKDADITEGYAVKAFSSMQMRLHAKDFSWLGSAWSCRKQRKHYNSFCRYGITISVHDFVYVMAEENKRLIAYIEDLYEDLKARKKVVVRWFHKIDEVNILLPPDVNDREIFFSLCLQDLSVECIDGLAAVLSAQHFEKYLNEAVQSPWKPFLCCRQVDNEDVKPFDITHLRGYWKQELLRSMYMYPKPHSKSSPCSMSMSNDDASESVVNHKHKRKNRLTLDENVKASLRLKFRRVGDPSISGRHASDVFPPAPLPPKKSPAQQIQQQLSVGCHVEVLSQDSGLRGCWFRCVILKSHQDKVKVKYQDLQDADETGHLEEWILSSRVAVPDKLGIRLQRTIVRPQPSNLGNISPVFNVGSVVDAWWHDGWWEGIVISKDAELRLNVYFPGEQRTSVFATNDLRWSRDWSCKGWNNIGDRPDLVGLLMSGKFRENIRKDSEGCTTSQASQGRRSTDIESPSVCTSSDVKIAYKMRDGDELTQGRDVEVVPELVDDLLAGLRWSSSRKRCPRGFSRSNPSRREESNNGRSGVNHHAIKKSSACTSFLVPQTLMADSNCKFRGDPFFSDSTAISNLVASR